VGWDETQGSDDPLYVKTQAIVQTVLDKFEDDVSLFAQLLEDFDDFLAKSEEQARLRAERSAKVMEGQERLQVAKTTTLDEIEPRIADREGIDFVREFITSHWKNLLFITCARNGKNSEAWQQAVKTMDDLIWSVKPKYTSEDRRRLVAIQPGLLDSLRKGMERLSVAPTERDDFIARLVRAHGRTAVNPEESADHSQPRQRIDAKPTPSAARREAGRPKPDAPATPAVREDHCTGQVRKLKAGDWIELAGNDGLTKRAKLSWVSPITGTFLFTDRQGLKVGNYSVEEIARLLRAGRAKILNAAPLMDRAVNTVLKEYQKH
jgi:hypothetical protein